MIDLITRARSTDAKIRNFAYQDLITKMAGITRNVRAKLGKMIDDDDAESDAHLALMRAVEKFDPTKGSFADLYATVYRRAMLTTIKHSQRECRNPTRAAPLAEEDAPAFTSPAGKIIEEAGLTDLEHRAIVLFSLGNSYDEIATMLETDPKSIDNAITRAKKKIRAAL